MFFKKPNEIRYLRKVKSEGYRFYIAGCIDQLIFGFPDQLLLNDPGGELTGRLFYDLVKMIFGNTQLGGIKSQGFFRAVMLPDQISEMCYDLRTPT